VSERLEPLTSSVFGIGALNPVSVTASLPKVNLGVLDLKISSSLLIAEFGVLTSVLMVCLAP
jgi:hypothetical protein